VIVPMAKVHVIAHRRRLDAVLRVLYRLRMVHLVDVTGDSTVRLPPLSPDEDLLGEIEEARYLRTRLQAVIRLVPEIPRPAAAPPGLDLASLRQEVDELQPEIERRVAVLDELTAERDTLPRHLASLRRLLPLLPEQAHLEGYEIAAVILEARHAEVLGQLNAELARLLHGNYEIISDRLDPDTMGAVVVFPRKAEEEVRSLMGREQVSRVRLPGPYETMTFRDAIRAMEQRLTELPALITGEQGRLATIVGAHAHWIPATEELSARIEQLAAIRRFGATPHTFVVTGWAPADEVDRLREVLTAEAGTDVLVESTPADPGDRPPVLMANVRPARPFHVLVELLALPRYGSLDPTALMALFLPLFFGMMLGDVAYGMLLLGISWLVRRRFGRRAPRVGELTKVLGLSAGWAVIWGVVYAEFFGDLGYRLWGWEPLWIHREEALGPLLVFAVAVGAAHVGLGLVLGIREAARARNPRSATQRLGLLVSLVGLFLLAATATDRLPDALATPAVAGILVGLVILMAVGGPMGLLLGPLELTGLIGNVLSYLRIAAIGLASVYLARVANELGAIGPLWLGVAVASLFHALNLALGAFSPSIQALRLHYVEFFGKFYDEGGEPYRPFGTPEAAIPVRATTT
jgi:V/A-type H+/Na+-transporting ATPase subunit I